MRQSTHSIGQLIGRCSDIVHKALTLSVNIFQILGIYGSSGGLSVLRQQGGLRLDINDQPFSVFSEALLFSDGQDVQARELFIKVGQVLGLGKQQVCLTRLLRMSCRLRVMAARSGA